MHTQTYKGEGILARGLQGCRTGGQTTHTHTGHTDVARSNQATMAETSLESSRKKKVLFRIVTVFVGFLLLTKEEK